MQESFASADNQGKHFNLLRVNVITPEDLQMFIADGNCTCLEDINVSTTDFDWDYAQRALIDIDQNKTIMWNDNIHTNIDDDIDNFLNGITYCGSTYSIATMCLLEDDMEKYDGVKY